MELLNRQRYARIGRRGLWSYQFLHLPRLLFSPLLLELLLFAVRSMICKFHHPYSNNQYNFSTLNKSTILKIFKIAIGVPVFASPLECKFSKGTEKGTKKVKNIGLKVKIVKNTPNVKSYKPLKNKESRIMGGSRLIYLVIRLGVQNNAKRGTQ